MKKLKPVKTFVKVFEDVMYNKKEYKGLVVPFFNKLLKTTFKEDIEKSCVGFYLKNEDYELSIENIGHTIKVVIAYHDRKLDRPFIFTPSDQLFTFKNILKIKNYLIYEYGKKNSI